MKLISLLLISLLSFNVVAGSLNKVHPILVVDKTAPPFTLKEISGAGDIHLADFKGKVVYVDFWASWCVPCRLSFPFLSSLRKQYGEQGFEIIAINLDEDPLAAQTFLQDFPVDYPVAMGFATSTPTDYQVSAMPSAFLLDAKGVVRLKHLGFSVKHQEFLAAVVEKLLAEK